MVYNIRDIEVALDMLDTIYCKQDDDFVINDTEFKIYQSGEKMIISSGSEKRSVSNGSSLWEFLNYVLE